MKIVKHVLVTGLMASISSLGWAQENRLPNNPKSSPQTLQQLDNKTSGAGVRASKLIGMRIYNPNNEAVGMVKDFVIDPVSNRIQYLAVGYGGFLGLGDKWFAVPVEAIQYVPDPVNNGSVRLQMNVSKERMNGAQGFDEAQWPNSADPQFTNELYKRYGVERRQRDGSIDVNVGPGGVNIDLNGRKK